MTDAQQKSEGRTHIASAGMDRTIRLWHIQSEESAAEAYSTHSLVLHTAPVSSIRSSHTLQRGQSQLISAGWDGIVGYWEVSLDENKANGEANQAEQEADLPRKKRRKGVNGTSTVAAKVRHVQPTLVLRGHTGQVSKAVFDHSSASSIGSRKAFSFGQDDHTVREWDLDAGGVQVSIKTSDKAMLAAEQLASPNLLATGNSDRTVTIFDMRDGDTIINLTMVGHTSSVSAISAHPTNPLLLCSGSYDGTVKIWDVRSPKQALFSLVGQHKSGKAPGKVLCTAWNGETVASGGEDAQLALHQSKGMSNASAVSL